MPLLTALAISIGGLGAIATWLFLSPLAGLGLQIWTAFVGWAAYYHSGGTEAALKTNIPAHIVGGLIGLLALIGTTSLAGALGVPVAGAICVGIGAALIVLCANIGALGSIPSSVYGFACTAGYALLAGKLATLTSFSIVDNPWLNASASLIIGALFGYVSEKIGGALAKKQA